MHVSVVVMSVYDFMSCIHTVANNLSSCLHHSLEMHCINGKFILSFYVYPYRVAKRIAASDQFDLDLNRDLFVIFARRTTESSALMAIQAHSGAGARYFPGIQVNPATDMTGTVRIINCRASVASIDFPAFWAEMSHMLWL